MNWGRFTTIASGFAVAALGLSLGLAGCAGAATTSAAAVTRAGSAAAAPQHVVLNCMDKAKVKPGTVVLACADNGLGLMHLHWTRCTVSAVTEDRWWLSQETSPFTGRQMRHAAPPIEV